MRGPNITPLAEVEKEAILNAMKETNGDKKLAAHFLGIGKTTLYRKLEQYAKKRKRNSR